MAPDSPWVGLWDEEIEPLASYQPQQVCSPSPKPGTEGFHDLVLRTYPDSGDFGISRDCAQGGRSEHKEGRAWDWGVNVNDPDQKEHAAEVIGWLGAFLADLTAREGTHTPLLLTLQPMQEGG